MSITEAERRISKAIERGDSGLNLSGLGLTSLPESIGQLTHLEWLYLGNNQLTSLPESIGQLTHLEWLYLSNNQLTSLPESIGLIKGLEIYGFEK